MNERKTAYNIGFAKWRAQCFYYSFVQGSSSVFQMNICSKNPPLRKAAKRYAALLNSILLNNKFGMDSLFTYF